MTSQQRIASNRRAINAYREGEQEPIVQKQYDERKIDPTDDQIDGAMTVVVVIFFAAISLILSIIGLHTVVGWLL